MKKRAIFFDRDGVINSDEGLYYVFRKADFRLNPGVMAFMKEMAAREFLLVVISNQGGIARGVYSKDETDSLHQIFLESCTREGIIVSEIYYCPHHNEVSACLCRKPGTLMIEKALARFGIDPSRSYFIGDRETDRKAALAAGIQPVIIEPNSNLMDYLPHIK